jgi:hypothetical protein
VREEFVKFDEGNSLERIATIERQLPNAKTARHLVFSAEVGLVAAPFLTCLFQTGTDPRTSILVHPEQDLAALVAALFLGR